MPDIPASSGLSWMVLARFADYVRTSGGEIAASGGAIVDETGMPSWPLADAGNWEGDAGELRFSGSVRYVAHFGALDVPVADPLLRVADGFGELAIPHPSAPGAMLPFARFAWRPLPGSGQGRAWLGDQVTLLEEAVHLFGGSYPSGMPLDPLIVVLADSP